MDIRNIQLENGYLLEGKTSPLKTVYMLGEQQFSLYKGIERLPEAPLEINSKKSQEILKDFIGRVIEEISECYTSYSEVYEEIGGSNGFNKYLISYSDKVKILNSLQNANEELADATAFFITLLIYSNILDEDIKQYVVSKLEDKGNLFESDVPDGELFSYGIYLLYPCYRSYYENNKAYNIADFVPTATYEKYIDILPAFNQFSPERFLVNKLQWFEIIAQLNYTRNLLKNRPWKMDSIMTKEIEFQESLVKSFLMFLGNLTFNGVNPEQWYRLFHKKQALNIWRVNTGY